MVGSMAAGRIAQRRTGSLQLKEPPLLTTKEKKYQLTDFEMLKTVGTGTFGRVWLCRHKPSNSYHAMKIMSINDVIRLKQEQHVKSEKMVLQRINHPFIIELEWTSHDSRNLYMLFEYICGGELFSYLRRSEKFSNETSRFYAAEIVLALEYLHKKNIVYRDLKPENLLLDREGHLKITDFGFAKILVDRTFTLCGTPEYLAPEIIQSKGHNKAVDWWALGILIFEMLNGYPPFFDDHPAAIYDKILAGEIDWPSYLDPVAKDLIKKLLVPDRTKRLGNMKNEAEDVKKHRWFKDLDWDNVYYRRIQPPLTPKVSYDGDSHNFSEYPEADENESSPVSEDQQDLFKEF